MSSMKKVLYEREVNIEITADMKKEDLLWRLHIVK